MLSVRNDRTSATLGDQLRPLGPNLDSVSTEMTGSLRLCARTFFYRNDSMNSATSSFPR